MALKDAAEQADTAITRRGFRGHAHENTFAGVPSFLRRTLTTDPKGVDIGILGVPFDQAVTNRPGARFGPRAIREASALQAPDPPYGWDVDPMCEYDVADLGDLAFDYARVPDFPEALRARATAILDGGTAILALGGDHSITHPLLAAHAARHGPMALVQFDAHADSWVDDAEGRIDHGTMIYKAVRDGIVNVDRSVQVGIRTVTPDRMGIATIDARAVHLDGPVAVASRIREIVGGAPAYLSFDVDALDPAFAPGTGTPVWGGLSSGQAAIMLRDLAGLRVMGGDVVEVAPAYDSTGATAIAGAHAATEILCLWCRAQRNPGR